MHTFDPNDYQGSDSARINHAIADARKEGFPFVRVFPRKGDQTSSRNYWLLDEAILLPDNMTLYLCNCKLKLSDQCRDNFIRSANCVPGRTELEVIHNLHIIGEGKAVLEGADHPRSTGDGGKTLGIQKLEAYPADTPDLSRRMTYGTDAGKEGEIQKGDWRNIGILLSYVQDFSIENLTLQHTHCWAVSLEYCRKGKVRSLEFLNEEKMLIDGFRRAMIEGGVDPETSVISSFAPSPKEHKKIIAAISCLNKSMPDGILSSDMNIMYFMEKLIENYGRIPENMVFAGVYNTPWSYRNEFQPFTSIDFNVSEIAKSVLKMAELPFEERKNIYIAPELVIRERKIL